MSLMKETKYVSSIEDLTVTVLSSIEPQSRVETPEGRSIIPVRTLSTIDNSCDKTLAEATSTLIFLQTSDTPMWQCQGYSFPRARRHLVIHYAVFSRRTPPAPLVFAQPSESINLPFLSPSLSRPFPLIYAFDKAAYFIFPAPVVAPALGRVGMNLSCELVNFHSKHSGTERVDSFEKYRQKRNTRKGYLSHFCYRESIPLLFT